MGSATCVENPTGHFPFLATASASPGCGGHLSREPTAGSSVHVSSSIVCLYLTHHPYRWSVVSPLHICHPARLSLILTHPSILTACLQLPCSSRQGARATRGEGAGPGLGLPSVTHPSCPLRRGPGEEVEMGWGTLSGFLAKQPEKGNSPGSSSAGHFLVPERPKLGGGAGWGGAWRGWCPPHLHPHPLSWLPVVAPATVSPVTIILAEGIRVRGRPCPGPQE